MKTKRLAIFGITGGIIGFAIHLVLQHAGEVSVFSIGAHAIQGTLFSVIGIVVGVFVGMWFFAARKSGNDDGK